MLPLFKTQKQINLENLQARYSKTHKSKISQKEIILNLLESQPDRYFMPWEIQGETIWGFLGIQARRRTQELAQGGFILTAKVGKYTAYSHKN